MNPVKDAPKMSIADRAMALFQRFGLRACTMDDVSRELSISKKTLYKFFTNKADLVDGSVRAFFAHQMASMEKVRPSLKTRWTNCFTSTNKSWRSWPGMDRRCSSP
jgi:AcrR family transcriptional regulator